MWNLESIDEWTEPAWDLRLVRVTTSVPEDDFFMGLPSGDPVLTMNGSEYALPEEWEPDESIWEMHAHMAFYFWLGPSPQEVTATFRTYDVGGMYEVSNDFTMRF
ncbi:MAG: hypothetical protein V1790_08040 [Planctomycetota bacterium]